MPGQCLLTTLFLFAIKSFFNFNRKISSLQWFEQVPSLYNNVDSLFNLTLNGSIDSSIFSDWTLYNKMDKYPEVTQSGIFQLCDHGYRSILFLISQAPYLLSGYKMIYLFVTLVII